MLLCPMSSPQITTMFGGPAANELAEIRPDASNAATSEDFLNDLNGLRIFIDIP